MLQLALANKFRISAAPARQLHHLHIGNLSLRDKHGHDTVDRAVMAKFLRAPAATIKWESVEPAKVVEIADKHWVVPELSADKK